MVYAIIGPAGIVIQCMNLNWGYQNVRKPSNYNTIIHSKCNYVSFSWIFIHGSLYTNCILIKIQ